MANTRKVLLSLHNEVADALASEKTKGNNMSAVVDAVLAAHYGLKFESGSAAASTRQSILDSLQTPTEPVVEPVVESTATQEAESPATISEPTEPVAPQEGGAQPSNDFVTAPIDESTTSFVPVVQPLDAVEPASEVQPAQPEVATPDVPALDAVQVPSEEAPLEPAVEPLLSEPESAEPVKETPVPVAVAVAEPTNEVPTTNVCSTCGQPKVTPICLNCL